MRSLNEEFKNRIIDCDELIKYGFVVEKELYHYSKKICKDQFLVNIFISSSNSYSNVIDLVSECEYVLVDVKSAGGSFVSEVKEVYQELINDIVDKCSNLIVDRSKQCAEVLDYIRKKYGDELEYLWLPDTNSAIWRNKNSNKWYGVLLKVCEEKLGISSSNMVDVIDLKYQKDKIDDIIDWDKIFPGYHMNKKSWITVRLNGDINTEEIFDLIDNSYYLSSRK